MKKVDLLKFLHENVGLSELGLKDLQGRASYAHNEYKKGLFEGQRQLSKLLINTLEAEEEVIKHEPDEIEWTGELIFFFENKDGSLIRANAIKGRFKYDGTYLCEYLESKEPGSSSPWFSLAYWDDCWVYDLGDEIKKSVHYDGIIIKELYLGD